ncbi:unnamed protein product [Parajaminaea phylloscopi]
MATYSTNPNFLLSRNRGLSNATLCDDPIGPPGKTLASPTNRKRGLSSATLLDDGGVATRKRGLSSATLHDDSEVATRKRGLSTATLNVDDSTLPTKEELLEREQGLPPSKPKQSEYARRASLAPPQMRSRGLSSATLWEDETADSFTERPVPSNRRPSSSKTPWWEPSPSSQSESRPSRQRRQSSAATLADSQLSPPEKTAESPHFLQRRLSSNTTMVDGSPGPKPSPESVFARNRRLSSIGTVWEASPHSGEAAPKSSLLLFDDSPATERPAQTMFRFQPLTPTKVSFNIQPPATADPEEVDPLQVTMPSVPKRTHSLSSARSSLSSVAALEVPTQPVDADTRLDVGPGARPASAQLAATAESRPTVWQKLDAAGSKARPFTVKYGYYGFMTCMIYFALIGLPLWNGVLFTVWTQIDKAEIPFGFLLFSGVNFIFVFTPLIFGRYEKPAPPLAPGEVREKTTDTALLIPCYKAAGALPNTIRAALKIFPAQSIFVVDNGNTEKGTDASEAVCAEWGVNYLFVPVGSKIGAEYVGINQPKMEPFKYVMVIDDDVELPDNLPLVTERFEKNPRVGCVGYTLQSIGPNGTKGTMVQQLQDLEYRLSGLRHCMGAKYGSATFPHGAIILWQREVFVELFKRHPGFKISEDLCFGIICRLSGRYVDFCSQVAVPTETPPYLFGPDADHPIKYLKTTAKTKWQGWRRSSAKKAPAHEVDVEKQSPDASVEDEKPSPQSEDQALTDPFASSEDSLPLGSTAVNSPTSPTFLIEGPPPALPLPLGEIQAEKLEAIEAAAIPQTRGGYGEMTVFKQRYQRWAFMHCWALIPQLRYHIFGWNLGWRTPVAQLLQFQDTLSTLFYLFLPFMLPCAFYYNAPLAAYTIAANTSFGLISALIFNAYHLHGRPEGRLNWLVPFASVPYRGIMRFVQLAAIYRGLIQYGLFFRTKTHKLPKHPKLGPMAAGGDTKETKV